MAFYACLDDSSGGIYFEGEDFAGISVAFTSGNSVLVVNVA